MYREVAYYRDDLVKQFMKDIRARKGKKVKG